MRRTEGLFVNILECKKICEPKNDRVLFLRVDPEDIKITLRQILAVLFDCSWVSKFDRAYTRESFLRRAEPTLADIEKKLLAANPDSISQDAGEYVVSELAREAIIQQLSYLDIPLAELYNKKRAGNPGFDFHSQTIDEIIIFGEAKYLGDRNAFGSSLAQIVKFIDAGKDIKDILDLEHFCSESALNAAHQGKKGFAAAFSAKSTASDNIIKHIQRNDYYKKLIKYQELLLVAVNI